MLTSLRDALWLATSALRAAPGRSAVLVAGLAVALFLPVFTWIGLDLAQDAVLARAASTPVLVGRKGDRFDLTLASLYFRGGVQDPVPYATATRLRDDGYGIVAPLVVGHTASGAPIVGTSLDYLDARGLSVASGRAPALLGDVVAGAAVADAFRLRPGARLRTDQDNLYNLVGGTPTVLSVVGLLAPTGTADDDAFFVDVKTAWVLDGALHGHAAVDPSAAVKVEADDVEASAAVMMFQEITDANRATFHLHGDLSEMPISAVAVWPADARRRDQLLGELALSDDLTAVRPEDVVRDVLDVVLVVRDGAGAWLALVAASTLAFVGLVVSLSLRLRRDELVLLRRIGASPRRIAAVIGAELVLITGAALVLAAVLAWVAELAVQAWLPG